MGKEREIEEGERRSYGGNCSRGNVSGNVKNGERKGEIGNYERGK